MGKVIKRLAILTGIAAAVGYLAGILTAPQSGRETRADIKNTARRGMGEVEKQLKRTLAELSDMIDSAKSQGGDMGKRASKELDMLMAKGKIARDKAREVLSAIHEGDIDDKDLKDAVAEATGALKHLRAYLQK